MMMNFKKNTSSIDANVTQGTVISSENDSQTELSGNCSASLSSTISEQQEVTSTVQRKNVPPLYCSISPIGGARRQSTRLAAKAPANSSKVSMNIIDEAKQSSVSDTHDLWLYKRLNVLSSINEIAKDWLKEFIASESRLSACNNFMHLLLRCAGFKNPNLPKSYSEQYLKEFSKQIDQEKMNRKSSNLDEGIFPSVSLQQQKFASRLKLFVEHIIGLSSKGPVFGTLLFPFLQLVIETFINSEFSKTRYTCALLVTTMIEAMLETYIFLLNHLENLETMLEKSVDTEILSIINHKIKEANEGIEIIATQLKQLFEKEFKKKLLCDVNGRIVALCIENFSKWILKYSALFVNPEYLAVLYPFVFQKDSYLRMQCLQTVHGIFTKKMDDVDENVVSQYYDNLKDKLFKLVCDKNTHVSSLAVRVISQAYCAWKYLVPKSHVEYISKLVYCYDSQLASAAGGFLWKELQSVEELDSYDILIKLAEFHQDVEVQVKEIKVHQLVNAIFAEDEDGILVNWDVMVEGLQSEADQSRETVLIAIKILVCIICKVVTGNAMHSEHTKPPEDVAKVAKKYTKKHQITMSEVFLTKLPMLLTKYNNEEELQELVSIPKYFVCEGVTMLPETHIKVQALLEKLGNIVTEEESEFLLTKCFYSLSNLEMNKVIEKVSVPAVHSIINNLVEENMAISVNFIDKVRDENWQSISEGEVESVSLMLKRWQCMLLWFPVPDEYVETLWEFISELLKVFLEKKVDWEEPASAMLPRYCLQIGKLMLLWHKNHAATEEDNRDLEEKTKFFIDSAITVICSAPLDHQLLACEIILHLCLILNTWEYVESNNHKKLITFLKDNVFVSPPEVANIGEYRKIIMTGIVTKLCSNMTMNILPPQIAACIFSQQIKCPQYTEILERTLKELFNIHNDGDVAISHLSSLLDVNFKLVLKNNNQNVDDLEELGKAWSQCVSKQVNSARMVVFHEEHIESAFENSLALLKPLAYFIHLLSKEDKPEIIKFLGCRVRECNVLSMEQRRYITFYFKMLQSKSSKPPTDSMIRQLKKYVKELPLNENEPFSLSIITNENNIMQIENTSQNSSSLEISSPEKRKSPPDTDQDEDQVADKAEKRPKVHPGMESNVCLDFTSEESSNVLSINIEAAKSKQPVPKSSKSVSKVVSTRKKTLSSANNSTDVENMHPYATRNRSKSLLVPVSSSDETEKSISGKNVIHKSKLQDQNQASPLKERKQLL